PVGESETATPALALAYWASEVSEGPSACTHITQVPFAALCSTFGRSRIAAGALLPGGAVVSRSRTTAAFCSSVHSPYSAVKYGSVSSSSAVARARSASPSSVQEYRSLEEYACSPGPEPSPFRLSSPYCW